MKHRDEISAGGLVIRGDEILMVKVRNLHGETVWTFPKGHLEKGETSEQAAVREVQEETGWRCRVIQNFNEVKYRFQHGGVLIHKTVAWFVMAPEEKTGEADPDEILETLWVSREEARRRAVYPSDKENLNKLGNSPGKE